VRVAGPDAEDYLQRMVSNDVAALGVGAACEALLLTAKARVIAPMVVLRRGQDDFLLLTEPELGETLRTELARMRFAAKAEIEPEEHASLVVFGSRPDGLAVATRDYGLEAWELVDGSAPGGARELSDDELETLRIRAGTPRYGREIDERILPAEAGLDERAVSFTKGCYPGQEPVARLRYRGHANRGLRRLQLVGGELPPYDAPILHEGKQVGRVTSAAVDGDGIVALGFVRSEVPADATLAVGAAPAVQVT
jgi:folate-binding protein YgfZ